VVAPAVGEVDKIRQLRFELAWQVIGFEQDPVPKRAVIALDLPVSAIRHECAPISKSPSFLAFRPEIGRLDGGGYKQELFEGHTQLRKLP
jgi:hypothetical protein